MERNLCRVQPGVDGQTIKGFDVLKDIFEFGCAVDTPVDQAVEYEGVVRTRRVAEGECHENTLLFRNDSRDTRESQIVKCRLL